MPQQLLCQSSCSTRLQLAFQPCSSSDPYLLWPNVLAEISKCSATAAAPLGCNWHSSLALAPIPICCARMHWQRRGVEEECEGVGVAPSRLLSAVCCLAAVCCWLPVVCFLLVSTLWLHVGTACLNVTHAGCIWTHSACMWADPGCM